MVSSVTIYVCLQFLMAQVLFSFFFGNGYLLSRRRSVWYVKNCIFLTYIFGKAHGLFFLPEAITQECVDRHI